MIQQNVYPCAMQDMVIDRALTLANKRGMNQSALARLIGVLPQHITNWKSRGVPPEKYVAIADALDCSLDELLGRTKYVRSLPQVAELWPLPSISESKLRALGSDDRAKIEAALLLGAQTLGIDIKK